MFNFLLSVARNEKTNKTNEEKATVDTLGRCVSRPLEPWPPAQAYELAIYHGALAGLLLAALRLLLLLLCGFSSFVYFRLVAHHSSA